MIDIAQLALPASIALQESRDLELLTDSHFSVEFQTLASHSNKCREVGQSLHHSVSLAVKNAVKM